MNEHKIRIYKEAKRLCEIDLRWYCEGNEYKIKIFTKEGWSIKLIKDNGIIKE